MPLLHQLEHLAGLFIIVAHRASSWIEILTIIFPNAHPEGCIELCITVKAVK